MRSSGKTSSFLAAAALMAAATATQPERRKVIFFDPLNNAFRRLKLNTKSRKRGPDTQQRENLRHLRRAQGGPGIRLNPETFIYEPRG